MPLLWYQEGRKRESEDRLDERVWTDFRWRRCKGSLSDWCVEGACGGRCESECGSRDFGWRINGALICMGDVKQAEKIWSEMTFSRVMDVDDAWMERLFNKENTLGEVISEMKKRLSDGGLISLRLRI